MFLPALLLIGRRVRVEMKLVTAAVYTNYTSAIVDDAGIEQEDAFIARPIGDQLVLRFSHV